MACVFFTTLKARTQRNLAFKEQLWRKLFLLYDSVSANLENIKVSNIIFLYSWSPNIYFLCTFLRKVQVEREPNKGVYSE